jgi:hypothetical protein
VFYLQKWYLDCVTDEGEAAVFYWAVLRWGVFRLRYGAVLRRSQTGRTAESYTLRPGSAPVVSGGDELQWACPALGVEGSWSPREAGFERTLLDTEAGQIHWRCISPVADAEVNIDNRTLYGMGYAEQLTMTLKPWHLPIQQLRWGRFHSTSNAMVWIEWRGSAERSWVFVNGEELSRATTNSGGVDSPDNGVHLSIDAGSTLRAGKLVNTALRSVRGLVFLMPHWRLARETKWLARGSLRSPAGVSAGWVVHEEVRWA